MDLDPSYKFRFVNSTFHFVPIRISSRMLLDVNHRAVCI